MESSIEGWNHAASEAGIACLKTALQPFHLLLRVPSWLFLSTLLVMLLRAPDLAQCWADRVAFGALVVVVLARAVILRQSLRPASGAVWPMAALTLLALADLVTTPYDPQLWSVAAAKYLVPFTLFYLAGLVFETESSLRLLEAFSILVLGYLAITSIAYVAGWNFLVFPKFILDPTLGVHAERARGPFLQAQANGTAMNLLGLLALDSYRRRRLRGIGAVALLTLYPIAILATKTRAVWLAFAVSTALFAVWTASARLRRVCLGLVLAGAVGLGALAVRSLGDEGSMRERLTNTDTVDFRLAVYQAGGAMFLEHPIAGWGASQTEAELAERIDGFRGDVFVVHNTYLEVVLEYGLIGFALYVSIVWRLVRLSGRKTPPGNPQGDPGGLLESLQGPLWPLLLAVYFVSGSLVVMNYQFVNGLVFTLAGILAAQQSRSREKERAFVT